MKKENEMFTAFLIKYAEDGSDEAMHSTLNVGKKSGRTSRKPRMVGIGLIRF